MSVSQEVLDQTINFWQAHSNVTLSEEGAREAVQNMSAFMNLMDSWEKASNNPQNIEANNHE